MQLFEKNYIDFLTGLDGIQFGVRETSNLIRVWFAPISPSKKQNIFNFYFIAN